VVHSSAVSTSECTTLRTGREDERALMILLLDAALPRSGWGRGSDIRHIMALSWPRRPHGARPAVRSVARPWREQPLAF
jgi:hypothetical protein